MILTTTEEALELVANALRVYPDLTAGGLTRAGMSASRRDPRIRPICVRLAADWLRALRRLPAGRPGRQTTADLLALPQRSGWWSSGTWYPSYGAHHAVGAWWSARGLSVPDWDGGPVLWSPYVPQGALVAAAVGLGVERKHLTTRDAERVRLLLPRLTRLQRIADQSPATPAVADLAPEDLAPAA